MESVVITVVAAVVTGGIVGILAGLLGVGGGTVLVPVFRLLFGMSAMGSTATSLFTIIPTSISGATSHIRGKTCVPKIGVALGLGGACLSPLGVRAAEHSPDWLIMTVVACIIIYTSITMFRKGLSMPKASGQTGQRASGEGSARGEASDAKDEIASVKDGIANAKDGITGAKDEVVGARTQGEAAVAQPAQTVQAVKPAQAEQSVRSTQPVQSEQPVAFKPNLMQIMKAVLIGIIAGFTSGFSGLGGGFIMVPLMLSVLHMPMKLTSGTSLIAIMILATPATVAQFLLGNVNLVVGIAVACGTIPGAFFGAKLVKRLPERTLRLVFASFIIVGAVLLVIKEVSLIG